MHRAMGDDGDAEVALQHVADIVEELHVERPVEAHLVQQLGVALGRDAALADTHLDRIARHQADQDEGQEDDAEEGRDHQADARQDEAEHES